MIKVNRDESKNTFFVTGPFKLKEWDNYFRNDKFPGYGFLMSDVIFGFTDIVLKFSI